MRPICRQLAAAAAADVADPRGAGASAANWPPPNIFDSECDSGDDYDFGRSTLSRTIVVPATMVALVLCYAAADDAGAGVGAVDNDTVRSTVTRWMMQTSLKTRTTRKRTM